MSWFPATRAIPDPQFKIRPTKMITQILVKTHDTDLLNPICEALYDVTYIGDDEHWTAIRIENNPMRPPACRAALISAILAWAAAHDLEVRI